MQYIITNTLICFYARNIWGYYYNTDNDILMQERDMKKLKESLDKLEKIRDKMEIRKGKGTKSYIKALNEVINELEKTL